MPFTVQAEAPPIREDADGALRVGRSRVLLELVLRAFQDGATPETIVQRYSTLALPDVYAVITYYLRHPSEIETYLPEREQRAKAGRQRLEQQQGDLSEIRARIQEARREFAEGRCRPATPDEIMREVLRPGSTDSEYIGRLRMSPTLEQLGIDRMPIEERIALAQEILDSVLAERPIRPLSEAKKQELDRRIADHEANPGDVIPWEQVEAEALARFQK